MVGKDFVLVLEEVLDLLAHAYLDPNHTSIDLVPVHGALAQHANYEP